MNKLIPLERIENKIYLIREEKVMLDRDLANLYGVNPRRLREQVKRNIKRFPSDFMFKLSEAETNSLVSQNAIPSKKHLGGHFPFVFTEHGALMLASVLKTKVAIEMSVFVVRVFVKLRKMTLSDQELRKKIEIMEKKYDQNFKVVFEAIKHIMNPEIKKIGRIGFFKDG